MYNSFRSIANYQIKLLKDRDESLNNLDIDKIREFEEYKVAGSLTVENERSIELREDE